MPSSTAGPTQLDGAVVLAARLPAGEARSQYDRVDLVNDGPDELGCDVGTVFLEDLRVCTDTLVGTRTSSVSSWRLTVWGA